MLQKKLGSLFACWVFPCMSFQLVIGKFRTNVIWPIWFESIAICCVSAFEPWHQCTPVCDGNGTLECVRADKRLEFEFWAYWHALTSNMRESIVY